jgi:hypothetical protein
MINDNTGMWKEGPRGRYQNRGTVKRNGKKMVKEEKEV